MTTDISFYLDLDGVMADYEGGIRKLGFNPDPALARELNRSGTDNPLKREMYEAIRGTDFYAHLDILPGACDIYRAVHDYDPVFLTASPKFGATEDDYYLNPHWLGAAYHKRHWLEYVFLPKALNLGYLASMHEVLHSPLPDERFICTTSARKWQFMHRRHAPCQVLIDDRIDNCRAWMENGGVAIYHAEPEQTLLEIGWIKEVMQKRGVLEPRICNVEASDR